MDPIRQLSSAERLAALAGLVAAIASRLGFVPGIYRDQRSLIVQSNGQDLATLVVGVPVLGIGLLMSARRSPRGRVVALGALGYLLYTYPVYAFVSTLGLLTLLVGERSGGVRCSIGRDPSSPARAPYRFDRRLTFLWYAVDPVDRRNLRRLSLTSYERWANPGTAVS